MFIQNLIEIHQLIKKILSINKILTTVKGLNSVENEQNTMNLYLININAYTKLDQILSTHIEQKHDINRGPSI